MNLLSVTNNNLITRTMSEKSIFSQIIFSHCTYMDIFRISADMIKNGHLLLMNPLLGNIPPYEMPFKTLVLTESKGVVDFNSLNAINIALKTAQASINAHTKPLWGKNELEEFKKNDLFIVERWLTRVYFPEYLRRRNARGDSR